MKKVAVRRVNEWDGPAMLKLLAPYIGTVRSPEAELPELQAFIQRIDRYTYGLGWIICEIDSVPAGFCYFTEDRDDPKNLFSVEMQLYVKPELLRMGVGAAMWELIRDMAQLGSRRRVTVRVNGENTEGAAFLAAMGFTEDETNGGEIIMRYILSPADENAERPTKPYLIDNQDYERVRTAAAEKVRV